MLLPFAYRTKAMQSFSHVVYFGTVSSHFDSIPGLFDLILYVPSTISQLDRDGSSWVEPVLS